MTPEETKEALHLTEEDINLICKLPDELFTKMLIAKFIGSITFSFEGFLNYTLTAMRAAQKKDE